MKKMIDEQGSIGIAGEFFVAAELTRKGFAASLTGKNTKTIDILASNKDGSRSIAIQVKTCNSQKHDRWKMSESSEKIFSDNLYYVLVNLHEGDKPCYYFVPSEIVANRIAEKHKTWLETPGKKGQKHNNTTMRVFVFDDEAEKNKYNQAWEEFMI